MASQHMRFVYFVWSTDLLLALIVKFSAPLLHQQPMVHGVKLLENVWWVQRQISSSINYLLISSGDVKFHLCSFLISALHEWIHVDANIYWTGSTFRTKVFEIRSFVFLWIMGVHDYSITRLIAIISLIEQWRKTINR